MQTIVTTCPKNKHLLETFMLLARRFYGLPIRVDVAGRGETKVDQLLRILQDVKEYFVLLEEDFWIISPVNLLLLERVWDRAVNLEVDRFSLQSRYHYKFSDWLQVGRMGQIPVYQAPNGVHITFSLEASIWKASFMRRYLEIGKEKEWSDNGIESNISQIVNQRLYALKIYALDRAVIDYRDAMIGGQTRLKVQNSGLFQRVQDGDGSDAWKDLGVKL